MNFPFPMFITTWHMFLATVFTQVLSRTTNMLPGVKEVIHRIFNSIASLISFSNISLPLCLFKYSKKSTSLYCETK